MHKNSKEIFLSIFKINNQNVKKIVADACEENPQLKQFSRRKLFEIADKALRDIFFLEETARRRERDKLMIHKKEAEKIKAIWIFSGPGTYLREKKNDRYKNLPWAEWMDRRRLNHAAHLQRNIDAALNNQSTESFDSRISLFRQIAKKLVSGQAPILIYNGREDENATLKKIAQHENIFIIDDGLIDKSVDQIKQFKLPDGLKLQNGDRIAIVSHAPHLIRIMHVIEKFRDEMPIPKGVEFQLFPLPSPDVGKKEYAEMETRGLLYYVFISGEASTKSYPYLI